MMSIVEEQLIRAALNVEQQKNPLTLASMTQVLLGKEKPAPTLIEQFLLYWYAIFDVSLHEEESRPPFPLQIVFFYLLKHPRTATDLGVAQALGFEEAFQARGFQDSLLGQALKKRVTSVISFWRTDAERVVREEEARGKASPMFALVAQITSPEEEFHVYGQLRAMHLATRQAHILADSNRSASTAIVEQLAHRSADGCVSSPLYLFKRYIADLSQEEMRDLFAQAFRIVLLQEPTLGQQGQGYIDQVVAYLRTHHRGDPREVAALLEIDDRSASFYIQMATKQLLEEPEVVALRTHFEQLEQQLETHKHIPEGYELYCLYAKDTWMRVLYLHADAQGVAIHLGKQGMYIEWTHVANLNKLERSFAWRPVPIIEANQVQPSSPMFVVERALPEHSTTKMTINTSLIRIGFSPDQEKGDGPCH